MMIDTQSTGSASPTGLALNHSGEEMSMIHTAEKMQLSKYALVAVAEARLDARRTCGDAALARPSAHQLERIEKASQCTRLDAEQALEEFEAHPLEILLYGCEGGFTMQELLHEMKEGVVHTI